MFSSTSVSRFARWRAIVASVALGGVLAGCTTFGGSDSPAAPAASSGSGSFMNFFKYGGATVPASRPEEDDEIDCPTIEVLNGMAALRQESGGVVRNQLSLAQTARECRKVNGQLVVKVGAEVRALLGPGGSPGTFTAPLRFVVKRGDKVVSTKLTRVTLTIPKNDTQASAAVVEENMPAEGEGDLEILVGFDPTGRGAEAPRGTRKRR